jgi:hypothetical protein
VVGWIASKCKLRIPQHFFDLENLFSFSFVQDFRGSALLFGNNSLGHSPNTLEFLVVLEQQLVHLYLVAPKWLVGHALETLLLLHLEVLLEIVHYQVDRGVHDEVLVHRDLAIVVAVH